MSTRGLRVRRAVGDNLGLVVAVCLVVVLLGGYLTYTTHVESGVETEQVQTSSWTSTTELSHSATVTTDTAVFPEGTVIEDRNAYLASIMPVVDGTLEYT